MFSVTRDQRDHVDVNQEEGEAVDCEENFHDSGRGAERLPRLPPPVIARLADGPVDLFEPRLMVKTVFRSSLIDAATLQKRCEPIEVEVKEKRSFQNQHRFYFVRCNTLEDARALFVRLRKDPEVFLVDAAKPHVSYMPQHGDEHNHRSAGVSSDNRDSRNEFGLHHSSHSERKASHTERHFSSHTEHQPSNSRSLHRRRTLESDRRRSRSRSRSRSRDHARQEQSRRHTHRRHTEDHVRVEPEQSERRAPTGSVIAGSNDHHVVNEHGVSNCSDPVGVNDYGANNGNSYAFVNGPAGSYAHTVDQMPESLSLNLSPVAPDVSLAELRKHMEKSGPVKMLYMTDDGTHIYAHVVFETSTAAAVALRRWDGTIGELSKRLVSLQAWFASPSTSSR